MYKVIYRPDKYPVLTDIPTKKEAIKLMRDLYEQDKADGCFTDNCYAIREQK